MFDMVLNIHMTLLSKKLCEREIARARTYDLVYATFMYAGSSNWFFFIYLRFHFCFMKFNLNRYLVIWEKEYRLWTMLCWLSSSFKRVNPSLIQKQTFTGAL